jgi:hypothetical protein
VKERYNKNYKGDKLWNQQFTWKVQTKQLHQTLFFQETRGG